jgi:hypothetical protein
MPEGKSHTETVSDGTKIAVVHNVPGNAVSDFLSLKSMY